MMEVGLTSKNKIKKQRTEAFRSTFIDPTSEKRKMAAKYPGKVMVIGHERDVIIPVTSPSPQETWRVGWRAFTSADKSWSRFPLEESKKKVAYCTQVRV